MAKRAATTLRNNLLNERDYSARVYLGLVGGIMLCGFVREVAHDVVILELSEPDGEGGYNGEGREVTVALQHVITLERMQDD